MTEHELGVKTRREELLAIAGTLDKDCEQEEQDLVAIAKIFDAKALAMVHTTYVFTHSLPEDMNTGHNFFKSFMIPRPPGDQGPKLAGRRGVEPSSS